MKRILNLLIVASILLTSCSEVEFKEVTPKKGDELIEFPKELIGKYIDLEYKDTLIINQTHFEYAKGKQFSHVSTKLKKDTVILKKANDLFILNVRSDNNQNWLVFPFKYESDKITFYYLLLDIDIDDKEKKEEYKKLKIKNIGLITEMKIIVDSINSKEYYTFYNKENYEINPTDKEFEMIIEKGYFVKVLEFVRLK